VIDPTIQQRIQECVQEMRGWEPKWDEEDIYYSACGSVLKYAEAQGQEPTLELIAAIQATVRREMHK
jgi:hypothetical protein